MHDPLTRDPRATYDQGTMAESEGVRTGAPLIGLTTYHRNGDHKFDLPAEYVDAVRRACGSASH